MIDVFIDLKEKSHVLEVMNTFAQVLNFEEYEKRNWDSFEDRFIDILSEDHFKLEGVKLIIRNIVDFKNSDLENYSTLISILESTKVNLPLYRGIKFDYSIE
jgi:hypothetical protein